MGGSKNKSPAQKEKSQKNDAGSKKTKKSKKSEKNDTSKTNLTVVIDEVQAAKYLKESNVNGMSS